MAVPEVSAEQPRRRWLYLQMNLQVEANVATARELMRRAAAVGYNGVVLADYKLNILDRVPDHYFRHMEQCKAAAAEHKLEIIPCVAAVGYSDGLLAHNPNLAEGLPVRDAQFVVKEGKVRLASQPQPLLAGGHFEEHKNNRFAGWNSQDFPGEASFADDAVRHGGKTSVRFERLDQVDPEHGHGRMIKALEVNPWRQYHASAWIRTEKFAAAGDVRMFAIGADGKVLSHSSLKVAPDQDWTEHHVVFNSLDNDQINFYVGVWGGKSGKLWIDDAQLEETAFVNLLRRDGCPLSLTSKDGIKLLEGKDFAELKDLKLGMTPYAGSFDVYHEPPEITLLPGSRIKSGQALRASFYHTVTVYENQVTCCLGHPQVFEVIEDQVRRVEELLKPRTYFLSHDEIRVANWCGSCNKAGRTAGELLAENVRKCVETVRRVNPEATVCIWSDMFDPFHNARKDFYLVNGDLADSWEGLDKDVVIVNWNSGRPAESLPWFGDRGHDQVLAGYYDGPPASISDWLKGAGNLRRQPGVMYTTWQQQYDDLEEFAKHAWGENK